MSGGHFDYAYFGVLNFSDELERELCPPNGGNYGPETTHELRLIVNKARQMAILMKEVEWLFSGDISEETFLAKIKTI